MATARLTAYGATAKGSGYADADDACEETTGGTQLLATDDSAVFAYAEDSDENTRVYLAKVASVSTPAHLYIQGDGYANGQKIYIPEQTIGGIFGAITTAGYYTVTIDGDFATAAYITAFGATETIPQPTACPLPAVDSYDYPDSFFGRTSDSGNDKQFQPMPDNQGTGEGILVDRDKNINLDYKMRVGSAGITNVHQVPFILTTVGPHTLRGRGTGVYKCTVGDGDENED